MIEAVAQIRDQFGSVEAGSAGLVGNDRFGALSGDRRLSDAGGQQMLVADSRVSSEAWFPPADPDSFRGVSLKPDGSRLLQSFRALIDGGKPESHFDLIERRNAKTGKYEVIMVSRDPAGRKFPVLLVEGNRSAPARMQEFGQGQPLAGKMSKVLAALNAPDNRLPAGSGGPKGGNPWDLVVGGALSVIDLGAALPQALEGLGRVTLVLPRTLWTLVEAGESIVTGQPIAREGASNWINMERREQFMRTSTVGEGAQSLKDGTARLLGADPNSIAYGIGNFIGPMLFVRKAPGAKLVVRKAPGAKLAQVKVINGNIATAPLGQVVDAVKRMSPEFIARMKTHPDTAGTFQALQNRLANAGGAPGAAQQLQRLTGSVPASPGAVVPRSTGSLPPASRPVVNIPNRPATPPSPGSITAQGSQPVAKWNFTPKGSAVKLQIQQLANGQFQAIYQGKPYTLQARSKAQAEAEINAKVTPSSTPASRPAPTPAPQASPVTEVTRWTYTAPKAAESVELVLASNNRFYMVHRNKTTPLQATTKAGAEQEINRMVVKSKEVWDYTPKGFDAKVTIFRRPDGGLSAQYGKQVIDLNTNKLDAARKKLDGMVPKAPAPAPRPAQAQAPTQVWGYTPKGAAEQQTIFRRPDGGLSARITTGEILDLKTRDLKVAQKKLDAMVEKAPAPAPVSTAVAPAKPQQTTTFELSTPTTPITPAPITPAPQPATPAAIAQTQSPVTRYADKTDTWDGGNTISPNPPGDPLGEPFDEPQRQPNSNNPLPNDDPLGFQYLDWNSIFATPDIDVSAGGAIVPRKPQKGEVFEFVDPVTGTTHNFEIGSGYGKFPNNADSNPVGEAESRTGDALISPNLTPDQRVERNRKIEGIVDQAIDTTIGELRKGRSLDDAIAAGMAELRGMPDAEALFNRKVGPAIWAVRNEFKGSISLPETAELRAGIGNAVSKAQRARDTLVDNLAQGLSLPDAMATAKADFGSDGYSYKVFADSLLSVPLDVRLTDIPYADFLAGTARPDQLGKAIDSRSNSGEAPATAAAQREFNVMLDDMTKQVDDARRSLAQDVRDKMPIETARDRAFEQLGSNPIAVQMFLGSLETDPIKGVDVASLFGSNHSAPQSVYDQILSDPQTAFQRFEVPESLAANPYSNSSFTPDIEFRIGAGLKLNQRFELTNEATGETIFRTGHQMGSAAMLPIGNRIWGSIWANRYKVLNAADPAGEAGKLIQKALGLSMRSDVMGTDAQWLRNASINPLKLGQADLLSFKNGDLKPALLQWAKTGEASGGLRFVPSEGTDAITAGRDKTSGQATVTVRGRLQLDAEMLTAPPTNKDFFGQDIKPGTTYYRLNSDLSTKPLRETYMGLELPFKLGNNLPGGPLKTGSGIEIRMEPNADTKVRIPQGAILPSWFVESMNIRFDSLSVAVRGISPAVDGSIGLNGSDTKGWLNNLASSKPDNVEILIGTGNPLFPGVQRMSAVPGKDPNWDAAAFDVRFGAIETKLQGSPDSPVIMPDIYGTLYPTTLNNSKRRVRAAVSVNLPKLPGELSIGPFTVRFPSANAELIGQLLTSGKSPSKLVTSGGDSQIVITAGGVDRAVTAPRWLEVWLDKSLSEGVSTQTASTAKSQIALPLGGKDSLVLYLDTFERSLSPEAADVRASVAAFRAEVLSGWEDGSFIEGSKIDRLLDLLGQMSGAPMLPTGRTELPPGALLHQVARA